MEKITSYNIDSLFPKDYEILFFHAHPDDETFLNAGILQHLLWLWRKCSIIYCAAWILSGDENSLIRHKEITNINDKFLNCEHIHFLDCLDSKYKWKRSFCNYSLWDVVKLVQQLLSHDGKYVFVWYDKRWGYGHKDHIKLNRVISRLNKVVSQDHLYYEITLNESFWKDWLEKYSEKLNKKQLPETKYWSKEFWTEESKISYFYELTKQELTIKRAMFESYKSQIYEGEFPLSLSSKYFSMLFGTEYLNKWT